MKKRLSLVVLMVLALMAFCAVSFAEESAPPADQISENLNFSSVEWHRLVRSDDFTLVLCKATIDKVSSTSVYIYGYTEASEVANSIGGSVTLQQWKNNQWNYYYGLNFSAYDALSASGKQTVTVESGYYYQVVTTHRALSYDFVNAPRKGITTKSIYVN